MIYLLVGGGEPDLLCLNQTLKEFENQQIFVVAVDAGYDVCLAVGLKPDLLLGDFDSLNKMIADWAKNSGIDTVELNPVKDDTDMEAALRLVGERCQKGTDKIIILSALGGRLDHTLGCLALLGLKNEFGVDIEIRNSFNRACMLFEGERLEVKNLDSFGKFISFLPVSNEAVMTLKGFKYPLESRILCGFNTLGISNEITDRENAFAIVERGIVLMVRSQDNIKGGNRLC